jgi:hypothetical protein
MTPPYGTTIFRPGARSVAVPLKEKPMTKKKTTVATAPKQTKNKVTLALVIGGILLLLINSHGKPPTQPQQSTQPRFRDTHAVATWACGIINRPHWYCEAESAGIYIVTDHPKSDNDEQELCSSFLDAILKRADPEIFVIQIQSSTTRSSAVCHYRSYEDPVIDVNHQHVPWLMQHHDSAPSA